MRMRTFAITTMSLVAALFVAAALAAPAFSRTGNDEDTHEYTIGIEGTEGVKLHMYLVEKGSTKGAPSLRAEIVTVPFETKFTASKFYVWFHTLEADEGIGGYRIRSVYKIDGELQGTGFGREGKKGKKGSKMKTGFGNL